MSLARVKTWISGEVLTASDLNAEFNNILNNAQSLISPFSGALDFDGNTLTLDAAAATQVVSSAAVSWNFTSGAKTGTPSTSGSVERFSAQTFTDSATAGSGTATSHVFYSIAIPTLAATNALVTTTDAATWYIAGQPAAGTNETITNAWGLWIDAGNVRFDDDIHWLSGQTFAQRGILAHANTGIRTYTFPDFDGTIATLAGTEALSNKTIGNTNTVTLKDTLFTIQDDGDATKLLAFQLSGITTGNTRTLTVPDFSGTIATLAGTETFTNKTLTAPALNDALSGDAIAAQAEMETGTAVDSIVSPGRQHFHASAAKAWAKFNVAGTIAASYNVASITDNGTGDWTVVIATDFSSGDYVGVAITGRVGASTILTACVVAQAAGTFNIQSGAGTTLTDPDDDNTVQAVFFGDQA